MREADGRVGARWGAAVALLIATVALSVLDALPLVLLPLGLLLLVLPPLRSVVRAGWAARRWALAVARGRWPARGV